MTNTTNECKTKNISLKVLLIAALCNNNYFIARSKENIRVHWEMKFPLRILTT